MPEDDRPGRQRASRRDRPPSDPASSGLLWLVALSFLAYLFESAAVRSLVSELGGILRRVSSG